MLSEPPDVDDHSALKTYTGMRAGVKIYSGFEAEMLVYLTTDQFSSNYNKHCALELHFTSYYVPITVHHVITPMAQLYATYHLQQGHQENATPNN